MKRKKKPVVKKVVLPRGGVARVVVPKGHAPVVAAVAPDVVEIVPVPVEKAKRGWWSWLMEG